MSNKRLRLQLIPIIIAGTNKNSAAGNNTIDFNPCNIKNSPIYRLYLLSNISVGEIILPLLILIGKVNKAIVVPTFR
jgi:hypothetical protein